MRHKQCTEESALKTLSVHWHDAAHLISLLAYLGMSPGQELCSIFCDEHLHLQSLSKLTYGHALRPCHQNWQRKAEAEVEFGRGQLAAPRNGCTDSKSFYRGGSIRIWLSVTRKGHSYTTSAPASTSTHSPSFAGFLTPSAPKKSSWFCAKRISSSSEPHSPIA